MKNKCGVDGVSREKYAEIQYREKKEQNDSVGKEWCGIWEETSKEKKQKKRTRWTEKETGMDKWCIMPAREERQNIRGIKTSTEGLLINDMHYVMCWLV